MRRYGGKLARRLFPRDCTLANRSLEIIRSRHSPRDEKYFKRDVSRAARADEKLNNSALTRVCVCICIYRRRAVGISRDYIESGNTRLHPALSCLLGSRKDHGNDTPGLTSRIASKLVYDHVRRRGRRGGRPCLFFHFAGMKHPVSRKTRTQGRGGGGEGTRRVAAAPATAENYRCR